MLFSDDIFILFGGLKYIMCAGIPIEITRFVYGLAVYKNLLLKER